MHGRTHVEMLKRRAGLGYIDKQLWVISILKSYANKKIKLFVVLYALLCGPF